MRITLGVTGGVAAYKAAELVRRLQQDNFTVQVVMTRSAREFITPLTFAALTGQKVIADPIEAEHFIHSPPIFPIHVFLFFSQLLYPFKIIPSSIAC